MRNPGDSAQQQACWQVRSREPANFTEYVPLETGIVLSARPTTFVTRSRTGAVLVIYIDRLLYLETNGFPTNVAIGVGGRIRCQTH